MQTNVGKYFCFAIEKYAVKFTSTIKWNMTFCPDLISYITIACKISRYILSI